ncbi:GNAT family N-acetyltransferase [Fibrella sp. HMF5335]|uniref:GNAT family N-acetyltransferase n=1 Tax=Fibrella rubiginis TaxID=2817060 RepID=A0A939K6L6_9BACT|nr:GNAT family N-acetyltransferase [Fibrella rubiginis]MBO0937675.1 GNAT family N-acetyltransferase [Fibrella rubiginis]
MTATLRLLSAADLPAYRALLLPGLLADADTFRIAPSDEENAPFPTRDEPDSFTLGAYVGKRLAGIVSFQREGSDRVKIRHKGLLFRMYVSPDCRGQGIAAQLIQDLIDRVRHLGDIEQINLTVVHTNPAKRLYERFGFQSFSLEKRGIKWQGQYLDEESMVLFL